MDDLIVRWMHVISAAVLFGMTLGSGFHLFFASLLRKPDAAAAVARQAVWVGWVIAAVGLVFQPVSGLYMAGVANVPLSTPWLAWSLGLYTLVGACGAGIIWLQMRMRALAEQAVDGGHELPERYFKWLEMWAGLGMVSFVALIVVFFLMVVKPA